MRMIGQNDVTAAIADAQARVNTLALTTFLQCMPQQECASDSQERQHNMFTAKSGGLWSAF